MHPCLHSWKKYICSCVINKSALLPVQTASQQCVTAQWIQPEVLLSLHVTEWKLLSCFFSLCLKRESYEPQVTWAIFQSCWHSAAKTTETFTTWEPGAQSKSEGARWGRVGGSDEYQVSVMWLQHAILRTTCFKAAQEGLKHFRNTRQ